MATDALKGTDTFAYDLPVSPFGTVEHTMAIPLYEIQPIDRRSRYEWWAEDYVEREIVRIGNDTTAIDVREIVATMRLDNEPTALKQMLRLALEYDLTLRYTRNSVIYPMRVVAVVGADRDDTPIQPDRDRHGFGEWEVRVHFRRTDGGTLEGIFSS